MRKLFVVMLSVLMCWGCFTSFGWAAKNSDREFRAVWITTVWNLDWPNKNDSPAMQQKALLDILDKATSLRLNAVMFQVRPEGDALYQSTYEPWSSWLTGTQGKAPQPLWDPLSFAVNAGHERGLEVHAWLNPYRAGVTATTQKARNHISKTHPELVKEYGGSLYINPGADGSVEYIKMIVSDIVSRYDVDGIHFDDYFYPYPKRGLEFDDSKEYQAYISQGGNLRKDDWRRDNVNKMIKEVGETIKAEKLWVKFGVSPFGIWQNGYPTGIAGLDSYKSLYSDSRKWLQEGWVDYLTPQIYWNIDAPKQSYSRILQWWMEQNTQNRHVYAGSNIVQGGPAAEAPSIQEGIRRIQVTRELGAQGIVFYSARALVRNNSLAESFRMSCFPRLALTPAMPWKEDAAPAAPENVQWTVDSLGNHRLQWSSSLDSSTYRWAVYKRVNSTYTLLKVIPARESSLTISLTEAGSPSSKFAVSALDRLNNESERVNAQ